MLRWKMASRRSAAGEAASQRVPDQLNRLYQRMDLSQPLRSSGVEGAGVVEAIVRMSTDLRSATASLMRGRSAVIPNAADRGERLVHLPPPKSNSTRREMMLQA